MTGQRQGQQIHVWFDKDTVRRLKEMAIKKNIAVSQLIRMWLAEKLDQK